jgi:hypothetical protein
MGETRVDLRHLLEDLRDAYPGAIEETVLTEIVANSLDSGATEISITPDPATATLVVADNGSGMKRRDLAAFHDIAASTKVRGEGIGFAGVGIKLSLLLANEVVTETRRGATHVATRWRLASKHKAPWKWEGPAGLVGGQGTAVRMEFASPLSPLLDPGYVEGALIRHFRPLLDHRFRSILAAHYPVPVRFVVAGREVTEPAAIEAARHGLDVAEIQVRLPRKRKAAAMGYLVRHAHPLPNEGHGIAVSTLGKVIKSGWDWIGISPSDPTRIEGTIEVPALAGCLTLNKADFIRAGQRGATFLSYRKAIQEMISRQLTTWGDQRDAEAESRRRAARPVERDLERVLVDLADQFPLLSALVERRVGGQRRLPLGGPGSGGHLVPAGIPAALFGGAAATERGTDGADAVATTSEPNGSAPDDAAPETGPTSTAAMSLPTGSKGPRRPARYGLSIQFAPREGDPELGRLVESTVFVNDAHPAYRRAVASRSEGYHIALSVAMALAPLAVEPAEARGFVSAFLETWGRELGRKGKRRT